MMPSCGSSTSPLPVICRLCVSSATTMTAWRSAWVLVVR
jgi:hypothetical protein